MIVISARARCGTRFAPRDITGIQLQAMTARTWLREPEATGTAAPTVQPFPRTGRLAVNTNLPLAELSRRIAADHAAGVYCYVADTVRYGGGTFLLTDSAPNVQGDLITLSTCKHFMRTALSEIDWKGTWVAGFTGLDAAGGGRNHLVYLMRVGQAFRSHRDLWQALDEPVRRAKSARLHIHGDLYEPSPLLTDPYNPRHYLAPRRDHVHCRSGAWLKDVDYRNLHGDRPTLLAGDRSFSFLWDHPSLALSSRLCGGHMQITIEDLIRSLTGEALV